MDDKRIAKQVLYSELVVGKRRQGGQFHNHKVQYREDVETVLDGQMRRDVTKFLLRKLGGIVCLIPRQSTVFEPRF